MMNKIKLNFPQRKAIAIATLFAMNVATFPITHAVVPSSTDICSSDSQSNNDSDIKPISFDEILGINEENGQTLFIDVDSDDFVLNQDQWYTIQAYVHSAFRLPTTEDAMKSALRFTETLEFSSDYRALLNEYTTIHASAVDWNTQLYPSLVDLSLQLANYSDIHLVFIQPLVDSLSELVCQSINLQTIILLHGEDSSEYAALATKMDANLNSAKQYLNLLTLFSNSRLTAVEDVKNNLLQYATELKNQSIALDVTFEKFNDILNQDNTEELRNRIDEISEEIKAINDEIAKKRRDVGLTAIGGGLSLLIGGSILGSQITKLINKRNELHKELDGLDGDLAHAVAFYDSYSAATISIESIDEKIEAALPHVESLKLQWQQMRNEFDDMKIALDTAATEVGLENLDVLLGVGTTSTLVTIAEDKWSTISSKAKAFAQNAYVTVEE